MDQAGEDLTSYGHCDPDAVGGSDLSTSVIKKECFVSPSCDRMERVAMKKLNLKTGHQLTRFMRDK
jgi:hypothetical protein